MRTSSLKADPFAAARRPRRDGDATAIPTTQAGGRRTDIGRGASWAGVGLKPQHLGQIMAETPAVAFFEVHAENYMGAGGPPHRYLAAIRERYPLSIHGVGLSLGGSGPLDRDHLERLCAVVRCYRPALVSEHLAWSSEHGAYLGDLLPLPYTKARLARIVGHVDEAQAALGRQILLENPSTYLGFADSELEEAAFLGEVAERTGCGLLLDVNNLYVSAVNAGRDAAADLEVFPLHWVAEVHLAGHTARADSSGAPLLVDSHDRPVSKAVWALYQSVIARTGPVPTLIERDADIPPWDELHEEALRADAVMLRVMPEGASDVAL